MADSGHGSLGMGVLREDTTAYKPLDNCNIPMVYDTALEGSAGAKMKQEVRLAPTAGCLRGPQDQLMQCPDVLAC